MEWLGGHLVAKKLNLLHLSSLSLLLLIGHIVKWKSTTIP